MPFKVSDGDERFAGGERDRFRRHRADQHTADQARSRRCRDTIEIGERDTRFLQRFGDDVVGMFHVCAGRDLGDHAAERAVIVYLR